MCVGATTCTLCEAGTYSAAGAAACADCPALSSSPVGSTVSADCTCVAGAQGQEWVRERYLPVADGFTGESVGDYSSFPTFGGVAWMDASGGSLGRSRLRVYGGLVRAYLVFNLSNPAVDTAWTIADADLSLWKFYDYGITEGRPECVPGSYNYRLRTLLDPSLIRVLTQSNGTAIAQSLKAVLDQPLSLGQSPFETEFAMNRSQQVWYKTNVAALVKHAIESSSSRLVAFELRHPDDNHRCSQFRTTHVQGMPRLNIFYHQVELQHVPRGHVQERDGDTCMHELS